MKKLIVVSHSDFQKSIVNKRWTEELKKYPELFTVHHLENEYPSKIIDVEKEQALIEKHDALIFQFPLYWFSSPPLLKQWLDDVFLYGWAYGSKGNELKGKKIGVALTAGLKQEDYQLDGKMKVTIEELLKPFETIALYCKADYRGYFILYDTHNSVVNNTFEGSAKEYIQFLNKF